MSVTGSIPIIPKSRRGKHCCIVFILVMIARKTIKPHATSDETRITSLKLQVSTISNLGI